VEKEAAVELTIPALLTQRVSAHGSETILRKKDRGIWKATTWSELDAHVRAIGQGLLAAGFGKGDVAAVLAETRPETVYTDLAILGAGGASMALHPEEEADSVARRLHAAGARCIFVEGEEQLDKVLTIRAACPALSRIVIFDMKGLRDFKDPQCESLEAFIANGTRRDAWDAAVAKVAADDPAVLLFPPGMNSGVGQAFSHAEVLRIVTQAQEDLGLKPGDERLAVLRMSDTTERLYGLYVALAARVISNYLESPETAVENLQQLQPTVFGADAEAWDRLHERMARAVAAATPLQRMLYNWAINTGRAGGPLVPLANLIVLQAVRRELGMNRLRLAYVGAETVSGAVHHWAAALGITIRSIGTATP
jgi:long-chain acyl-CoA synthetase